ncbi:MAG: hypothetical protein AB4426_05175 [Xenococcaceae cyanobacterium]
MALIREIVQQAMTTGYLNLDAEDKLQQLLKSNYDLEDFNAFMSLQWAIMDGHVKQESLELLRKKYFSNTRKTKSGNNTTSQHTLKCESAAQAFNQMTLRGCLKSCRGEAFGG